ncbi:hypothetical protein FRC00_007852, partial [Tulasnella sp. 408]
MLNVSKETLLDILGSMGVELPSDTTMTTEVLEKRLKKAIDAAQFVHTIIPSNKKKTEIDIGILPKWSAGDGRIQFTVDRTSWQDALSGLKSALAGFRDIFDDSIPEGRDAFVNWRYLLNLLGQAYDAGRPGIILVDGAMQSAVLIKIHEIRAVNFQTPIIVVHFRHAMDATGRGLLDFGPYQHPRSDIQAHFFVRPAQYLVLRALEANAKRIPSSYAPVDPGLTLSFLLPVGTIEASETGKLAKNNVFANVRPRTGRHIKAPARPWMMPLGKRSRSTCQGLSPTCQGTPANSVTATPSAACLSRKACKGGGIPQ